MYGLYIVERAWWFVYVSLYVCKRAYDTREISIVWQCFCLQKKNPLTGPHQREQNATAVFANSRKLSITVWLSVNSQHVAKTAIDFKLVLLYYIARFFKTRTPFFIMD